MKSKSSAPGKIILFGEHFVVYGVKAVLCAINKRVTVTAEKTVDAKISVISSMGTLVSEPCRPLSEIHSPLKPLYYLADTMVRDQDTGIKVVVDSEIPAGVGLGSSSACCVAGAAAISGLFGQNASREEILNMAIQAEKTIFADTSGADCTVCTYGGIISYDKANGFESIASKPDFSLVVANSNLEHSTESVVAGVRQLKERDSALFSALCSDESRLVGDVLELLKTGNGISELGQKAVRNQQYLEAIGVSNDTLRAMVQIGQKESFGAKITGAGGGGCIFALTDDSNLQRTLDRFRANNYSCFSTSIDFKGLDTF